MNAGYLRGLMLVLTVATTPLAANEQTEQFIPIGQSPGVSGVSSLIGTLAGGVQGQTLQVQTATGLQQIQIISSTRIWVDRNAQQRSNYAATAAAMANGQRVEVKVIRTPDGLVADWVKIQAK